jgi:hypothetical protein
MVMRQREDQGYLENFLFVSFATDIASKIKDGFPFFVVEVSNIS